MAFMCVNMFRMCPKRRFIRQNFHSMKCIQFGWTRDFCVNKYLCSSYNSSDIIINSQRHFSKVKDSFETEVYLEEVFDQDEANNSNIIQYLRHQLYPDSQDIYIQKLLTAESPDVVFDILDSIEDLQLSHMTQSIGTLYLLLKLASMDRNCYTFAMEWTKVVKFQEDMKTDPRFEALLEKVEQNIDQMNFTEAAFTLMVIRRFGFEPSVPLNVKLFLKLINNVDKLDQHQLGHLTVSLRPKFIGNTTTVKAEENAWKFGLLSIIPRLEVLLESCNSALELKSIAICLNTLAPLVSDRLMDKMSKKFRQLVNDGEYKDMQNLNSLKKLLALGVTKSDWHKKNIDHVVLLLEQHIGKVHTLTPIHVVLLDKIIRITGWPIALHEEIYTRLCELAVKDDWMIGGISHMGVLANLTASKSSALPQHLVYEKLNKLLHSDELEWNFENLFKLIKTVGVSDHKLLDEVFTKVFDIIKDDPDEFKYFMGRYRRFQTAVHGHYRNRELEELLGDLLEENVKNCIKTRDFCEFFSYLLPLRNISEEILDKFYYFLPQMNTYNLMMVSEGLKSNVFIHNRRKTPLKNRDNQGESYQVLDEIALALHRQANHHLENRSQSFDIRDIGNILRSLEAGIVACDENFHKNLNEAFSNVKHELNLITANALSLCLASCARLYEFPEILDSLLKFYDDSPLVQDTSTRLMDKVLLACFHYNRTPSPRLLQMYAQNLYREMDGYNGFQVLGKVENLAVFQALPKYLSKAIFSSEFMDQLDTEMKTLPDNHARIQITRKRLMRLNRCLVLQYPDYGVPWFHQQYCEQHPPPFDKHADNLKGEVYKELCTATDGWRFVKLDTYAKYYNHVFIELALDAQGNLIDLYTDKDTVRHRRIAIQTYDESCYTRNTKKLRGDGVLNNQQLRLQGWEVVTISPFRWNSMYLADSETRVQYLQETIQAIKANTI